MNQKRHVLHAGFFILMLCVFLLLFGCLGGVHAQEEEELINIPVTKIWNGESAGSVTVQLFAGDHLVSELTLTEDDDWQGTFWEVQKYDNGTLIDYRVDEVDVPGYSKDIAGNAEDGFVIYNTPDTSYDETIDISVNKIWIGPAADSATAILYQDNVQISTLTLDEYNEWASVFRNLPKYDPTDGHEYLYSVGEEYLEGYQRSVSGDAVNGFTLYNTITETVNITVSKVWIGPAGGSVTALLYADDVLVDEILLDEDDNWQNAFGARPRYSPDDGHEIDYQVDEYEPTGYAKEVTGNPQDGYVIYNYCTETIDISVGKIWQGEAASSATIYLKADDTIVGNLVLNEGNDWFGVFDAQPRYSEDDGHEILYSVVEEYMDGYEADISGSAVEGFTIVNYEVVVPPYYVDIDIRKIWIGPELDEVYFDIYQDDELIWQIAVSAEDNWAVHLDGYLYDLPRYAPTVRHEYVYTVVEQVPEGYVCTSSGDLESGFVFVNTNVETVTLTLSKVWLGPEGDSATFMFYRDNALHGSFTLTAADSWVWLGSDFLRYDPSDGHEYNYSIAEEPLDGYSWSLEGTVADGFTATNYCLEQFNLNVKKVWIGDPAESVKISLYLDDQDAGYVVLSAENGWEYTFVGLFRYSDVDGHEIVYTIQEEAIEGYTSTISGSAADGFVVTNEKLPPDPGTGDPGTETPGKDDPGKDDPGKVKTAPKTGDVRMLLAQYLAVLAAMAGLSALYVWLKKERHDGSSIL